MSGNEDKRGRTEPTLGDLNHLDAPPPPPSPPADDLPRVTVEAAHPRSRAHAARRHRSRRHRPAWLWPLLVVLVAVVVALAWVNQDHLRALLPRTEMNSTLTRADQALATGYLDGHDGTSARELYAQALAQEPDNDHARNGLQQVGNAELARASSALKAGDYAVAQASIASARELLGGGAGVDRLADALQKVRHPPNKNDAVIEQAQQALAAGKVGGADGAAALYRRALNTDPDNAVARHGLDKAGDALAAQARDALQKGDTDTARAIVQQIGSLLPHDGDLPALRASLAQAKQKSDAAVRAHLQQGQDDLRKGQFSGDGDDNALAQFRAVLAVDPDNAQAKAGLGQVAQALILRANAAMDGEDTAQAAQLLKAAAALAPKSADLAAARSRLRGIGAKPDVATAQPAPTPLQQVEVTHLVRRAQAAVQAGDIMLPPGASAYDLYRKALAINGSDQAALAGLQSLPTRTTQLFEKALAAHDLDRAGGYLATLGDLAPGDEAQQALSRRLADAWLDRAQNSVDRGDHDGAVRALAAARRLRPDAPRLHELAARLRGG